MLKKKDGSRELMVIDPETLEYRSMQKVSFPSIENGKNIEDYSTILKDVKGGLQNIRDEAIFLSKLSSGMDDVDLFNLNSII